MTNVFFSPGTIGPEVKFDDINVGVCFIIATGKGACYMKVSERDHVQRVDTLKMLEIATDKIWPVTKSLVCVIDTEISVHYQGR